MPNDIANNMGDTINQLENYIDMMCAELAELFECPCNFSPMDEIMWESGKCEDDCGEISSADCWRRYFDVKLGGKVWNA